EERADTDAPALVAGARQPDPPLDESASHLGNQRGKAPDRREGVEHGASGPVLQLCGNAAHRGLPICCSLIVPLILTRGEPHIISRSPCATPALQAPPRRLVPRPWPRPALAPDPRPLPGPDLRSHAAADPGRPGRKLLASLPGPLPHHPRPR